LLVGAAAMPVLLPALLVLLSPLALLQPLAARAAPAAAAAPGSGGGSAAAWRCALVVAGAAAVAQRGVLDAAIAAAWHSLRASPVFGHDSFEPLLSVAFLARRRLSPPPRKLRTLGARRYFAPAPNSAGLAGTLSIIFYLGPLLLIDWLCPRRLPAAAADGLLHAAAADLSRTGRRAL